MSDIVEIRGDIKELRNDIKSLNTKIDSNLKWIIGFGITTFGALALMMAHGFHWL